MELGRNDKCYCGSGKKYKKCCLGKDSSGNSVVSVGRDLKKELLSCNSVRECKRKLKLWNELYKNSYENVGGGIFDSLKNGYFILTQQKGNFYDWVNLGLKMFKNELKDGRNKYSDREWGEFFKMFYVNDDFNKDEYDIRKYVKYMNEDIIDYLRKDNNIWDRLDDEFMVYRGVNLDVNDKLDEIDYGGSWSLEKRVGIWFGRRFYEFVNNSKGYLISGKVYKDDVLMCIDNVGEEEVVLMGKIRDVKVEELEMKMNVGDWKNIEV